MVTDFGDIRRDLKELADFYDHAFDLRERNFKVADHSGVEG